MTSDIFHEAIVLGASQDSKIRVELVLRDSDSCGGCALAGSCSSQGSESRKIVVDAVDSGFENKLRPGMTVRVKSDRGTEARATTLMMTLPLAGLVIGAVVTAMLGVTNGALNALGAFAGALVGFLPAWLSGKLTKKPEWIVTDILD